MKNYITHYKAAFFLSWVTCYFLYPSWVLPLSVTGRALVFLGLIIHFSISAFFMNRWFNEITVVKPFIIQINGWLTEIKSNLWLFSVLCIAAALNLLYISSPIFMLGDESIHITDGLWIYKYISSSWHIYLQFITWGVLGLILILRRDQTIKNIFTAGLSEYNSNNLLRRLFVFFILCMLVVYFFLYANLSYYPSFIRYPPLTHLLYLASYLLLGINHIAPRILQLIFCLLSAIYIYRTINLFSSKEAALLGASIYLFLPIVFFYSHTAETEIGTNLFIIMISYYFLKFIENRDNRDLLLTSFLISIGFLYKLHILLMLIICTAYFIFFTFRSKGKDFDLGILLKVLIVTLVPIIPWMIISKFFSWRNYNVVWPHVISIDRHTAFLSLIPKNISWLVFSLFLLSIIFILRARKNNVSLFFGFMFIAFYFFLVADVAGESSRLSLAFYPTIVVFLSQLVSETASRIKWKRSFQLIFVILMLYLIAISSVPQLNVKFYRTDEKLRLLHFPSDKALNWVKDNVKDGDKIVMLRVYPAQFYIDKLGISRDRVINFWFELVDEFGDVSTLDKLKEFCVKNKVSFIMFPYAPEYPFGGTRDILKYLKINQDNEFVEIAKFNVENNFIYIYKLNEETVER